MNIHRAPEKTLIFYDNWQMRSGFNKSSTFAFDVALAEVCGSLTALLVMFVINSDVAFSSSRDRLAAKFTRNLS